MDYRGGQQQGSTALIMALVIAAGLGATLYYSVDKTVLKQQEEKTLLARDRSAQMNISGIAQPSALMAYHGAAPSADDQAALPYIYPDPYINNTAVGLIRAAPAGITTWKYQAPSLNLFGPDTSKLRGPEFDNYAFNDIRPPLTDPVVVKFLGPMMDATHPQWIRAYRVQASAQLR